MEILDPNLQAYIDTHCDAEPETLQAINRETYLKVQTYVVGEPKQIDGTPSQSAIHVKGFVNLLKKTFPEIPVEMMDERFTSKMASAVILQSGINKKARQNKALVDNISATILLQGWLEKKSNR